MTDTISEARDKVLADRLDLAGGQLDRVLKAVNDLIANPPTSGDEQEQSMRSIEESISNLKWRCNRLSEFVK